MSMSPGRNATPSSSRYAPRLISAKMQAVANLFVGYLARRDARASRFFGKQRLDLRIGNRFAALADRFVVLEISGHRLLSRAVSFRPGDRARSCARSQRPAAPCAICQATSMPGKIAHGERSHRETEMLRDARRSAPARRLLRPARWRLSRNRRSCGCR